MTVQFTHHQMLSLLSSSDSHPAPANSPNYILNMTSHGVKYPLGQLGSTVLAVSPLPLVIINPIPAEIRTSLKINLLSWSSLLSRNMSHGILAISAVVRAPFSWLLVG